MAILCLQDAIIFKMYRLLAASALIILLADTQAKEPIPVKDQLTAREIIDHATSKADEQYELLVDAMFESEVVATTKSLDADGEITETEWTRHRRYPIGGALFAELVEIDGRPLNEKERRNVEKEKQDFIREVERRTSRGEHPQPESEPGIRFGQEFVERYQFTLEGIEVFRGYSCWVIRFEPKQGELPVRNRMDRALNQSTGKFWVSRDDYGLARVEFALRKPFKYWGGFLAVIRNTDGSMDLERVERDIWMPSHFDLKLDLKVMMVKNIRRHITIDYNDYRRADELAATHKAVSE